jgi:uncharacterized membrane protein
MAISSVAYVFLSCQTPYSNILHVLSISELAGITIIRPWIWKIVVLFYYEPDSRVEDCP